MNKNKLLNRGEIRLIILIAVFAVCMIIVMIIFRPFILDLRNEEYRESFSVWIKSHGLTGVIILLGVQILQIFIAVIPGGPIQIIAGMAYETWGGFAIIVTGCVFTSALIFFLVRKFGMPLLRRFFGEKEINTWVFLKDTKKTSLVIFILFLIPGLPKDLFTWLSPLTSLSLPAFVFLSVLARMPAILTSTITGDSMMTGNWILSISLFLGTGIIGLLGIWFKDRIIKSITLNYDNKMINCDMKQNPVATYLAASCSSAAQSSSAASCSSAAQQSSALQPFEKIDNNLLAYLCSLSEIAKVTPEIAASIVKELENQRKRIKLIASENYCSFAVQLSMGNLLTDKYAEGVSFHRFYGGTENVDAIESLAAQEACKLFGAQYANVQPHCGSDANLLAYWAILCTRIENKMLAAWGETNLYKLSDAQWKELKTELGNQKLLTLDYYSGGHLTHGYRNNISSRMFDVYSYSVSEKDGLLDYNEIEKQAKEIRPFILLAGYSAYPRKINFKRMREIADKTGAVLLVDMAHFAGLVAGKVFTGDFDPVPWAHVLTSTTHKTLRGPRAGLVLSTNEFAETLDKGCPLTMGGPLPHVIAAKAVAFREAAAPEFRQYAQKIVSNCQALAASCIKNGLEVLTGGTDNHLALINVHKAGITGRQAESALQECHITVNRNSLPRDPNGPWYTSGLRIGTAAITTLGMQEAQMEEIGALIASVVKGTTQSPRKEPGSSSKAKYNINVEVKSDVHARVKTLMERFPVYPQLDLELLKKFFVD